MRRDLRRRGCTCTPAVAMLSPDAVRAAGAVAGAIVRHQLGCQLGDQLIPANRAGRVPSVVSDGGCHR